MNTNLFVRQEGKNSMCKARGKQILFARQEDKKYIYICKTIGKQNLSVRQEETKRAICKTRGKNKIYL